MSGFCRHFGVCGGCSHQDLPDADYRALKRRIVADALARHGVDAVVEDVVEVPPGTRRRATLKAKKTGRVMVGFHAARSHDIVDVEECPVLVPALERLLPGLRPLFGELLAEGEGAEFHVTDTDTGIDLSLRWRRPNDPATLASLARWAVRLRLARISAHGDVVVELVKPSVRFGKATVLLPPEPFLQPTREGEAALQAFVLETLAGARRVADLFAGCGTFALPLAAQAQVQAVDLEGAMLEALAAAGRSTPGLKPVTVARRNLFKRPLTGPELALDGVCLDPPRAGALAQAGALAASKVCRIAYVSCDAETFARDARVIIGGGYRLDRVVPIDQFLWSSHIEVMGAFERT